MLYGAICVGYKEVWRERERERERESTSETRHFGGTAKERSGWQGEAVHHEEEEEETSPRKRDKDNRMCTQSLFGEGGFGVQWLLTVGDDDKVIGIAPVFNGIIGQIAIERQLDGVAQKAKDEGSEQRAGPFELDHDR